MVLPTQCHICKEVTTQCVVETCKSIAVGTHGVTHNRWCFVKYVIDTNHHVMRFPEPEYTIQIDVVNFAVYSLVRLSGVQSANMMRELYRCVWASA